MKRTLRLLIASTLLLMVALLAFPGRVLAQSPTDDGNGQVIFGGTYKLKKGETLNGGLAIFGGQATLEENSTVNGDIVLMGGTLDADSQVNGNVTGIGGTIILGGHTVVSGDVNVIGATLQRAEKAIIQGQVNSEESFHFNALPRMFSLPTLPKPSTPATPATPSAPTTAPLATNLLRPIGSILWAIFQAVALAALAILVALMAQQPTERVAQSIMEQPAVAAAMGLLTLIVAPALVLLLLITIILIPVGVLGLLLVGIAILFGYIALGLELGRRIAGMFKAEWLAPVSAGVGVLVLTLVVRSIAWIPCVGWLAPVAVGIVALGGVVLSRFGSRVYSPAAPTPTSLPPAPPAAP
ncbi:MAG: hypothetical protein GYA59_12535, partial [Chloroflexi bacterium]|nr:hypothetical protein [Chloroflexota bacterium]